MGQRSTVQSFASGCRLLHRLSQLWLGQHSLPSAVTDRNPGRAGGQKPDVFRHERAKELRAGAGERSLLACACVCACALVRVPCAFCRVALWSVPSKSLVWCGHQCLSGLMAEGGVAWHAHILALGTFVHSHLCALACTTPSRALAPPFSHHLPVLNPTDRCAPPGKPVGWRWGGRPVRLLVLVCLWRLWLLCLWVFGRLCVLFVVCGPSQAQTQVISRSSSLTAPTIGPWQPTTQLGGHPRRSMETHPIGERLPAPVKN